MAIIVRDIAEDTPPAKFIGREVDEVSDLKRRLEIALRENDVLHTTNQRLADANERLRALIARQSGQSK